MINVKKDIYFKEFNILRGIAVILVVIGHSFIGGTLGIASFEYIHKFIYSFHMPIFFFISGFFAQKVLYLDDYINKKDFIKTKFKKLIIPYISITLVAIPLKLIMNSFVSRPIVLNKLILDIVFYPTNNPVIALWFIYTLFFIFIISIIFNKLGNKRNILFGIILLFIASKYKINMFNLYGIFRNIIFFFIGLSVYERYEEIKETIQKYYFVIITTSTTMLLVINYLEIKGSILIELVYMITGILGILLTLTVSIMISEYENKCINIIGKYSLDIYLFSWFTQNCIGYSIYKILKVNYLIIIIITFCSGFLPIIISKYIIRKNYILSKIFLGM